MLKSAETILGVLVCLKVLILWWVLIASSCLMVLPVQACSGLGVGWYSVVMAPDASGLEILRAQLA